MMTIDSAPRLLSKPSERPARPASRATTAKQIALTLVISWLVPFVVLVAVNLAGYDLSSIVFGLIVVSALITSVFMVVEGAMALRQLDPPDRPTTPYPKASAIIAAYLPNEESVIMDTLAAFVNMDYPADLQVIVAYNTPHPLPVEQEIRDFAEAHPQIVPFHVEASMSKAQNVNAALNVVDGEFVGIFDSDHQPRPDSFARAWRWLDAGYDVVQGHCLSRNGGDGWLAKMVAVEFESIYSVSHPGRARMHHFGIFGGTNGYWRTSLLAETPMRPQMLTEDIDSTMRVIERGFTIRSDRKLVSRELATTTFSQLWNQRLRWAQGWFQVSLSHLGRALTSEHITLRQKFGMVHLLVWREIYPWISQLLFPLIAFWMIDQRATPGIDHLVPALMVAAAFTFAAGPLQAFFAYRLADQEIKQHRAWFLAYFVFCTPFYTEYKNLISRVAHVKQLTGEREWKVTPRTPTVRSA